MAYTVKKLAKLSGVSVRTLHFYDQIGLLKPAYYGSNHYRYYEDEQLLSLQQILFFRELGFSLSDIHKILNSNDFDKVEALRLHRHTLQKKLERVSQLIETIDKTMVYLRGELKMNNEELYHGFGSEKQRQYERYLLDSGKVSQEELAKVQAKTKRWQKQDWEKIKGQAEELNQMLVAAIQQKLKPTAPEVQSLIYKHYEWIRCFWKPSKESYRGLGQLYCEHPDFRKFYEHYHPRLPEYLAEAMKEFAKCRLS